MNPTIVYQFQQAIEQRLPSLGKWQATGLTMLCLGVLMQQQCQIRRMSESLPAWGTVNTVRQRLKRWLNNSRIPLTAVCYEWITWVSRSFKTARPLLLVDETKLGDRFGVMLVSWAYEGRAIPLFWRCYYANSASDYPQQGQVLLIYGLLAHVLAALPPGSRPLVQMDRGLAHSAAMLRVLKSLPVDFLVRVKQTARFTTRRGHSLLLRQLVKYDEYLCLSGSLFAHEQAVKGWLCLIWEPGQKEAWCLFTNLRHAYGARYALRWWQEESFKDLKSGGWQWEQAAIHCPERMARLLLAMAIAYGWMLSLGTQLDQQPPAVQREVALSDDLQRLSLFRLGLRWFKRLIYSQSIPPVQVELSFMPPTFRSLRC